MRYQISGKHIDIGEGRGLRGGIHHRGVIGHIHLHRVDHRTQLPLAQLFSGLGHACRVAVPDGDTCTGCEHALRNGKTQTGGGTGDDRMAAFHVQQIHGVFQKIKWSCRRRPCRHCLWRRWIRRTRGRSRRVRSRPPGPNAPWAGG